MDDKNNLYHIKSHTLDFLNSNSQGFTKTKQDENECYNKKKNDNNNMIEYTKSSCHSLENRKMNVNQEIRKTENIGYKNKRYVENAQSGENLRITNNSDNQDKKSDNTVKGIQKDVRIDSRSSDESNLKLGSMLEDYFAGLQTFYKPLTRLNSNQIDERAQKLQRTLSMSMNQTQSSANESKEYNTNPVNIMLSNKEELPSSNIFIPQAQSLENSIWKLNKNYHSKSKKKLLNKKKAIAQTPRFEESPEACKKTFDISPLILESSEACSKKPFEMSEIVHSKLDEPLDAHEFSFSYTSPNKTSSQLFYTSPIPAPSDLQPSIPPPLCSEAPAIKFSMSPSCVARFTEQTTKSSHPPQLLTVKSTLGAHDGVPGCNPPPLTVPQQIEPIHLKPHSSQVECSSKPVHIHRPLNRLPELASPQERLRRRGVYQHLQLASEEYSSKTSSATLSQHQSSNTLEAGHETKQRNQPQNILDILPRAQKLLLDSKQVQLSCQPLQPTHLDYHASYLIRKQENRCLHQQQRHSCTKHSQCQGRQESPCIQNPLHNACTEIPNQQQYNSCCQPPKCNCRQVRTCQPLQQQERTSKQLLFQKHKGAHSSTEHPVQQQEHISPDNYTCLCPEHPLQQQEYRTCLSPEEYSCNELLTQHQKQPCTQLHTQTHSFTELTTLQHEHQCIQHQPFKSKCQQKKSCNELLISKQEHSFNQCYTCQCGQVPSAQQKKKNTSTQTEPSIKKNVRRSQKHTNKKSSQCKTNKPSDRLLSEHEDLSQQKCDMLSHNTSPESMEVSETTRLGESPDLNQTSEQSLNLQQPSKVNQSKITKSVSGKAPLYLACPRRHKSPSQCKTNKSSDRLISEHDDLSQQKCDMLSHNTSPESMEVSETTRLGESPDLPQTSEQSLNLQQPSKVNQSKITKSVSGKAPLYLACPRRQKSPEKSIVASPKHIPAPQTSSLTKNSENGDLSLGISNQQSASPSECSKELSRCAWEQMISDLDIEFSYSSETSNMCRLKDQFAADFYSRVAKEKTSAHPRNIITDHIEYPQYGACESMSGKEVDSLLAQLSERARVLEELLDSTNKQSTNRIY
eukprot:GHVL01027969.1.p1 GENE.GHVL01027969.1~~GHVL01027969.1.p1  ORF type:complete len:1079 (-),score=166.81 GHVL01027969.1:2538-5774(-)